MLNKKLNCNIMMIKKALNTNEQENIYIMEKFDLDLEKWIKITDYETRVSFIPFIIKNIKDQMLCLLKIKRNFIYTDLKPENILVKLDQNKKIIKVSLGDLGSVLKDDKEYVSTYPCINHNGGFIHENELKTIKDKNVFKIFLY